MNIRLPAVLFIALAGLHVVPATAWGQPLRYSAQFASGKRFSEAEIRDWHDSLAEPRLESLKLFFPGDRVRWIEDNSIPPAAAPQAFVEFFGGDRLPGRVTEYHSGQESIDRTSPPTVVVIPEAAVDWPETKRLAGLPVIARWLRRIVWQKREDGKYRPGTLFYRDGRQVGFRGVRWSKTSVRLLVEQETRDVAFEEIAELHLPVADPWEAWFQQLAAVLPDLSGFIMQFETGDGLRATASSKKFAPAFRGDAGNPDHWYQAVHPAWSTEPLWLRHRAIRMRRFFAPHEAPLSAVEPVQVVQWSYLAGGWNWQLDRNVHALPQRSGDLAFGWGLGVQAYCELAFDLPACARAFRTQYGLDWTAGSGGCASPPAIFAGTATGRLLHRSGHLIGSQKLYDSGPLPLTGVKQLTLVVDPAQDDRPAGADPFEIRDSFNWLQPLVELDLESLRQEIDRRIESPQWGWAGWALVGVQNKPCTASVAWDMRPPPQKRSRIEISPRDTFFTLARRLEIKERDQFLVLSVSRLEKETGPSRIQVRIGGSAVAEFNVPVFTGPVDPDPLLVPIERFRRLTTDVEIVQIAQTPQSRVEWHGIGLASRDPDLDRLTNRLKNPPSDPMANLPPDVKASVERIAVEPGRFGEVLAQVAPAFSTSASEQGVWLLKSFQGKPRVVRTHPPAQGQPCILRAAVAVPAGKRTELRTTVAPHPQSDWQLLVFANGEKLHDSLVAANTTQEGWTDVVVDLSRFAGRNILLEVHNHPNNWSNEFAYWQRLEVVVQ